MPNTYVEAIQAWFASMAESWSLKLAAGSVMALLTAWFSEDAWLIAVLLCLIAVDTLLGMVSAVAFEKKLSGKRLHQGIIKYLAYAASIVMVWLVQEISIHSLPIQLPVLAVFAAYQSLTEMSSIARHLNRLGIKLPALLIRILDAGTSVASEKTDALLGAKKELQRPGNA